MNDKITLLKAEAYDILAQIEAHQLKIAELQKALNLKNAEIKECYGQTEES